MKPPIETIRLSQKAKEQLVEIKKQTGIENWNILCRYGFCLACKEEGDLSEKTLEILSSVEMSWKTFSGDFSDVYSSIFYKRYIDNETNVSEHDYFMMLLHHGIAKLSVKKFLNHDEC